MPYAEDDVQAAAAAADYDDLFDGPCGDMVVVPPLSASDETPYPSLFPGDGDVNPAVVPPLNSYFYPGREVYGDEAFNPPPRRKRQKTTSSPTPGAEEFVEEDERRRKAATACEEESRRGFQKLWTNADEITILEGFLEFTSRRGTAHSDYQHDTGPFCDQIKERLQLDFSKNQIVEKLRRLKKKYRSMAARKAGDGRFVFRSAHDQVTFDIASKIWNPTFKRANRPQDAFEGFAAPNPPKSPHLYDEASEDATAAVFDPAASLEGSFDSEGIVNAGLADEASTLPHLAASLQEIMGAADLMPEQCATLPSPTAPRTAVSSDKMAEQTAKSGLFASLVELLQHSAFGGGMGSHLSTSLWSLGSMVPSSELEEKWKQQRILELEVYLKRLDLVYEQVSLKLETLRGEGGKQTSGS